MLNVEQRMLNIELGCGKDGSGYPFSRFFSAEKIKADSLAFGPP